MKKILIILLSVLYTTFSIAQNYNNNNNSNTIIINSQPPVIHKTETVYRTEKKVVYKDRPAPSRVARKLSAPVCLQGYLWVYPEDLGNYSGTPTEIIRQLNRQGKYGRDNWRVPTYDELNLMRNEADRIGLGPLYSYMSSGSSGTLRLVSTGQSIAERNAEEQKRIKEQQEFERRTAREAELKRKQEEAESRAAAERERTAKKNNQSMAIRSGQVVTIGSVLWQIKNYGANSIYDAGQITGSGNVPVDWRLPSLNEFRALIYKCRKDGSYYKYGNLVIPEGTYLVMDGDNIRAYNPKLDAVFAKKDGLIRAVCDIIY